MNSPKSLTYSNKVETFSKDSSKGKQICKDYNAKYYKGFVCYLHGHLCLSKYFLNKHLHLTKISSFSLRTYLELMLRCFSTHLNANIYIYIKTKKMQNEYAKTKTNPCRSKCHIELELLRSTCH